MNLRAIALGLACSAALYGQYGGHKFSWQESCFKNPRLPYCQGNEYAVKPTPAPKNGGKTVVTDPVTGKTVAVAAAGIDWEFADPAADAIAGINVAKMMSSPMAHDLIAQWAASQGFAQPEVERLFEALLGVDQLAVSVRGGQTVVIVTGRAAAWRTTPADTDWKSVPAPGGALLFGNAAAVDQALRRLTARSAIASETHSGDDFWAVVSPALLGADAEKAGVKRLTLSMTLSDRLATDSSFELNAPPDAQQWPASLSAASVEGNVVHLKSSIEPAALAQAMGLIAADPSGQSLTALAKVARALPTNQIDHSKPVIYGLDDGPKQLGH